MAATQKKPAKNQKKSTASAPAPTRVPGAFSLFKDALVLLARHWRVFGGITAIYGLLTFAIVQGFQAVGGVQEAKEAFSDVFGGGLGALAGSTTLFIYLLGSSGNPDSPTAGVYQFFLGLIVSLALIWALRQVYAGHQLRVRDAFYRGMTPLVSFSLILLLLVVQLLPLALGLLLYSAVTVNGVTGSLLEQWLWLSVLAAFVIGSLYLMSSSLFALYICTLPDMTPMRALRSARELVRGRRWLVIRKIVFLPIVLLVLLGVLIIPLILFAAPIAGWAFLVVTFFLLPVVHAYMYGLYRSLL